MAEGRSALRRPAGVRMAVAWGGRLVAVAALVSPLPLATPVQAQSVTIPLQYVKSEGWRLIINVGINGGAPQPYMFDTGSSVFNAAFNPATWPGFGPTPPAATVPNGAGVNYCYGAGVCYNGNLVQVPVLDFYVPGAAAGSAPAATLAASQGYQINAAYDFTTLSGTVLQTYPAYFQTSSAPPLYDTFYGVFGAGNFATLVRTGATVGGVLGQTILPGVASQGYVVSANGQPNPAIYHANGEVDRRLNPPSGNQIVTIGGQSRAVSPCVACVTVGLTPQLIGQFALPTGGVVPWAETGRNFPNPYGGTPGNSGSTEFGSTFTTGLTAPGGPTVSQTSPGLLDTGTPLFALSSTMSGGSTTAGTTLSISGATATGGSIAGIPTVTSTLTGGPSSNDAYSVSFNTEPVNVLGIPFFMQNSVMFDLSGQAIGYTPFYVTAAALATTANGPLIVNGGNVPLGLAGVISGPGGVTVEAGGLVQLSATNSYAGPTTIAAASGSTAAGQLLVSGPGSIASSAGVATDGVFDISRAWAPVAIQTLSGSGQVNLGGQNLILTNASGSFSGTLADGGAFAASGGSLTLAGGSFTLAGQGLYTGGTMVTGGTFTLSGSLSGPVSVQPQGSFAVAAGGSLTGAVSNSGRFANDGVVTGAFANAGVLSGSGTLAGTLANAGTIAPGNSIGTANIAGNYVQLPGSTYLAEVAGNGQSDLINVGGAATLQGGSVSVRAQPSPTFGSRTTYRILAASGGVAGTYASIVNPYPFLLPSLSYDADSVYLTLQVGGFAAAGRTPTQAAVGRVLDAAVDTASGDFAQVLSAMASGTLSSTQAQATLTALSGNNYAGLSTSMVQGAQLFMNNFASQAGGGSPASSRVALAEACTLACDATADAVWGAWGGALGGLGVIGANAGTGAVTYSVGGFAAGLDRLVAPGLRVGVTAGYTSGTQWVSGFSGNGATDTFLAGLYGGYKSGKVYADAVAGYAYSALQMWRPIALPGLAPRTAQGRTGSNQFYGQVEAGYSFDIGTAADASLTPFARLQAYTGTQNGFTETGAQSLNLTVAQQSTNSVRSVLGAQLGGAIDLGWREKLALLLRLGWSHEYASTARPVTATLAGAPLTPFTTYGVSPQRDGVLLGFSADTAVAEATSLYLRYEGDVSGQDSAHALSAGLRLRW